MENSEVSVLQKMAAQSPDINFIYHLSKGRFTYVNDAFEAITERQKSTLLDNPNQLFDFIHPDDVAYVKSNFKKLLKRNRDSQLGFRIVMPDHREKWIKLKVYPIFDSGKIQYLTGIAEDESSLKAGILNMQKVNAWKDANLEILSHDLRGPIFTIRTMASLISKKIPLDDELSKLTSTIEQICQHSIDMILSVVKNEALDTVKVAANYERVDLVAKVQQAMDIYMNSQQNINKNFRFTHSHPKIYAEVDSMKFLQLINNLVSNGMKFPGDGGHITVHLEKKEDHFLATVSDDGIGIPADLITTLFEKYTPAARTGLAGEASMGLGMWIVKTFTELHGGHVWVESVVNEGTTFYVEFPLEHQSVVL